MSDTVEVVKAEYRAASVVCPECQETFLVSVDFARYGTKCPFCKEVRVQYFPGSGTARRVR